MGFFVAVLILAMFVPLNHVTERPETASGCKTAHAPILVDGDLQFTPAYGVTGGNGTISNPYPSPNGTFPFAAVDLQTCAYAMAGVYDLKLTVRDDDGGVSEVILAVDLGRGQAMSVLA